MTVNAISGADLVSAISQNVGQGAVPVDAGVGVLKKAIASQQDTEQQLIATIANIGSGTGTNLNVYG